MTADEKVLATIDSDQAMAEHEYAAYIQLAIGEAEKVLADKKHLSETKARAELYRGGYTVYTAFDSAVNQQLSAACHKAAEQLPTAVVITDTQGQVCAVYNNSPKENVNYALGKYPPCSAFKPLSVYAPAMDAEVIDWFSQYIDSPYSQLKNESGIEKPWPTNANNVYTKKDTLLAQAMRESTNTVAVKCLADYGVENSIAFLENNLGVDLTIEKNIAAKNGPDEVIGNLALGSIAGGVSPLDMAGYYQIFANGGFYQTPQAVTKLCRKNGKALYTANHQSTPIIKPTTSAMMNYLLQEVVSSGTGKKAACKGVTVAGKTGTDDNYQNNWFVGVTPDYSCAVWHGPYTSNISTEIFSAAMTAIYEEKTERAETFPHLGCVRQVIYCPESGMQFTTSCPSIEMGYQIPDQELSPCDMH